jgi:DMSO/TMAO reductase YedYZ molybdopterin-dependent catalytic subunit
MLKPCLNRVDHLVVVDAGPRRAQLTLSRPLLGPHPVDGAPVCERHDPGKSAARGRVEAGCAPPDLEQNLLHDLFGLRRIPQHAPHRSQDGAGGLVIDDRERALVTAGDGADGQLEVAAGRRTAGGLVAAHRAVIGWQVRHSHILYSLRARVWLGGGGLPVLASQGNPVTALIRITSVSDQSASLSQPLPEPVQTPRHRGRTLGLGAALGIATALLALGIAQLVAAAFNSQVGGPVDAVGEVFIDHTPPWLKNFAIREFGSNDKTVLVWGIRGVLIIFAVIIGILALRRLWQGMLGLAVFIIVGIVASESQPTSKVSDVLPTLIGGLLAALFLRHAVGLAAPGTARRSRALPPAQPAWDPLPPRRPYGPASSRGTSPGAPTEAAGPTQPGWPAGPDQPAEGDDRTRAGGALSGGPVGPYIPQADLTGADDTGSAGPGTPAPWAAGRLPQPQPRPAVQPYATGSPDRRKFLLQSGAAAVGGLLVYGAGSWLANTRAVSDIQHSLKLPRAAVPARPLPPGTDLKIPGLSSFITPNSSFYRVDTAIVLPEILPANWQLRVHGMVQREITLSFAELIKRPLIEDYITLCCVSNPVGGPYIGNAKWLGASLRSLLREAGIKAGANQLLATSSDGFTSGSPVDVAMDGRDSLLAVAMNDQALPIEHGFPVRQVIPGLYGYVSACKWIVDIEVTTYAASQAYWVPRGWSAMGPIKTESRIDVPGYGASIKAGTRTAIAGEAWAQHKGIEAVEVRIGNGPWQQAELAAVPDLDTWRQWVYYWDAAVPRGSYMIEARATDKTGYTQTSLAEYVEPNGASGYPSTVVSVT